MRFHFDNEISFCSIFIIMARFRTREEGVGEAGGEFLGSYEYGWRGMGG